jgi:hypothetical protein
MEAQTNGFIIKQGKENRMPSQEGAKLSQTIRQRIEELNKVCAGVDEATASRAPEGRWSPKEILSHVWGPEGVGLMPLIQAVLEQDTPLLEIEAANPFFAGKRSQMTFAELLAEVRKQYSQMADVAASLSKEQLARKAHVPLFKETPVGEYPTLENLVQALAEYHLGEHIDHMREILQALGGGSVR